MSHEPTGESDYEGAEIEEHRDDMKAANERLLSINAALSNADSLLLFDLASRGLRAGTSGISDHNFSKKRFYVRLKELVDLGLVEKEHGVYRHTPFGAEIYEIQVRRLREILKPRSAPEKLHAT
jgi:hypothetical protein